MLLFGLSSPAMALPHVLFQDSHQWVASPKDLTPSGAFSWALPEIAEATAWEIIDGYPGKVDGVYTTSMTFAPEKPITRAEFAKILAVSTGLSDGRTENVPFDDVKGGDWYAPYVSTLHEHGVIRASDRGSSSFEPNQPITRLDMALWAERATVAYGVTAPEQDLSLFADASAVPTQFRSELAQSVGLGIIKGATEDGITYLYPAGTAKRVEATAMVMRALNRFNRSAPSMDTLEAAVRSGLTAYLEQGKVVGAYHKPPEQFANRYVEQNAASIRLALEPYFSPGMLSLVKDVRSEFLPYNLGGGPLVWSAMGYTVLNDLVLWGGRGLDFRNVSVVSVTPQKVLDRYAEVEVRMDLTRYFPSGIIWEQVHLFRLHLKLSNGRWLITQRTFVSEKKKGY
ncbi:MAG TPA: S-layer homology domain-containing protein [Symbiobacteriaceae bacterium]